MRVGLGPDIPFSQAPAIPCSTQLLPLGYVPPGHPMAAVFALSEHITIMMWPGGIWNCRENSTRNFHQERVEMRSLNACTWPMGSNSRRGPFPGVSCCPLWKAGCAIQAGRASFPPSLPHTPAAPIPLFKALGHAENASRPRGGAGPGPRAPRHGSASGTTGMASSARQQLRGTGTMQQKSPGIALSWKPHNTDRRMGKRALICHLFSSFFLIFGCN